MGEKPFEVKKKIKWEKGRMHPFALAHTKKKSEPERDCVYRLRVALGAPFQKICKKSERETIGQ